MTEDEHKELRCGGPSPENCGSFHATQPGIGWYMCSGSKCSNWRWDWMKSRADGKKHGYCGLAGIITSGG